MKKVDNECIITEKNIGYYLSIMKLYMDMVTANTIN